MDLGNFLLTTVMETHRNFVDENGIAPRFLLCGCCNGGCLCVEHAPQQKPHVCWYHNMQTPGGIIDGLVGLVEKVQPQHSKDSECTMDATTGLCIYCGVDHSDFCPDCNGSGFHKDGCPQIECAASGNLDTYVPPMSRGVSE